MSRYIVSDLHGDYLRFKKLLKKIEFNKENDVLYILGDVFDRGPDSLLLLNYILEHKNMCLIKGNHELFAQLYLEGKLEKEQWVAWGGTKAVIEVDNLTDAEKIKLHDILSSLRFYIEIEVNGEKWILTHSGLDADCIVEKDDRVLIVESIERAICNNEFKLLISNDIHYLPSAKINKFDKYIVVGHTPVMRLNEDFSCKILHKEKYMCVDSGAGHRKQGGKMSCYCIETQEEVYL